MSDLWVPWATKHPFPGKAGSPMTGSAKKITLHTMEVVGWPGYGNGASTPHFSVNPANGQARQHVALNRSARALASPGGGKSPNINAGQNIQIEIAGHAKDTPGYNDAWYKQLAEWLDDLCKRINCPRTFPFPFGGNETYGRNGSVRVDWPMFERTSGILGHQHVPFNDHWDPGKIDVARLQKFMGAAPAPRRVAPRPPAPAKKNVYVHVLQYGATNSDSVKFVQQRLIQLGYRIPAGATGNWFGQTQRAVQALQRDWKQAPQYATGRSLGPRQVQRLFAGVSDVAIHP